MAASIESNEIRETCQVIQTLLGIDFPQSYRDFLINGSDNGRYTGLSFSWELDSVLGATEFLRAARPDLSPQFVVLCFEGDNAVCLDIGQGGESPEPPVVVIDLDSQAPPAVNHPSLAEYLRSDRPAFSPQTVSDEWFQKGLAKLDEHMGKLSFEYRHNKGGQLPRSHYWRPYRFCVQDIILGITVIRHNRTSNHLEVDVFLTASISEYEKDSGCRALTLILLADAYKSGGSMEIRFTKHVEGGRIPADLVALAAKLHVSLSGIERGQITPSEAKRLFMALSGFRSEIADRIDTLEEAGLLSAASVCYAMHHGVWSPEEIEIILALSRAPETILAKGFGPDAWHLFQHDLSIGRTALFGSYLDRHLLHREHRPNTEAAGEEEMVIELEDDEREITIGFIPEFCAKLYRVEEAEQPVTLPWSAGGKEVVLSPGVEAGILLRARDEVELRRCLPRDIALAAEMRNQYPGRIVAIMVPADFNRLGVEEQQRFREEAGETVFIVCPEFVNQLDLLVWKRLEAVKVMRK